MKIIEYVKNFREGSVKPKVDTIRGTFPYLSNSGYANVTSAGLFTSVLLVPSSKRFVMEGFMVNNSADANYFVIYDAASASAGFVTFPPYQIAASKTDVVTGLKWVFQSGVYISTGTSTITIRVHGYLIASEVA